jgi:surfeit locus 1 family protein
VYRFARRPLWILSHLIVVFLIVMCVSLGLWQLRRHDERADKNAAVQERSEQPVEDYDDLLAEVPDPESARYRPVTVTGAYVDDSDLLIDNRSNEGLPGAWVMTLLRTDDDALVAVSRGFLGFDDGVLTPPPTPEGEVTVTGTALPWDDACGIRTDDDGRPIGSACVNRDAMTTIAGEPVEPLAVQQVSSTAGAQGLVAVPLPELDAGPHRSYAVQWFIFATIAVVGYPLVLRKVARDKARAAATTGPDAAAGPEPELEHV